MGPPGELSGVATPNLGWQQSGRCGRAAAARISTSAETPADTQASQRQTGSGFYASAISRATVPPFIFVFVPKLRISDVSTRMHKEIGHVRITTFLLIKFTVYHSRPLGPWRVFLENLIPPAR